jgi:hypothetical protein
MECNKWEETGLLYTSRELDGPVVSDFEKHLAACLFCNDQLTQYSLEKKQFFTHAILCEETPDHLDEKILAMCSKPMVPTSIGLFSASWFRKAVFSSLIFALGVGAGGYFTFAYYYKAKTTNAYADARKTAPQPQTATATQASVTQNASSLALDTSKQRTKPLLKPGTQQGDANSQGIVTVDLKKEE